jgi:dihydroneopterin aldolase
MSFGGYHGVLPFEREIGQRFIVDVELLVDLAAAGASDDLHETLNYAEVYAEVKRVVEGPPHRDLIEAVAHDVAQSVLGLNNTVETATVKILKPQAPIPGGPILEHVGIEITRHRG